MRNKPRNEAALDFRQFAVRAQSINEAERTFEAVIASENPVEEIDWDRMEMVPRTLLASGAEWPSQVPLLDSHNRRTTDDQIGSIRQLRVEGTELVGRAHVSSESTKQWNKVREGHITDMSAGFRVLREIYVPEGKTQVIDGRTFRGPMNVATKWRLFEGSIVPIGADEQAKMRGLEAFKPPANQGRLDMKLTAELRQEMATRAGLPADTPDEQLVEKYLETLRTSKNEDLLKPGAHDVPKDDKRAPAATLNFEEFRAKLLADMADVAKKAREEEKRAMLAFRKDVDGLLEIADRTDLKARCYELPDLDAVRALILEEKAKAQANPGSAPIRLKDAQPAGELRKAIGSALNLRAADTIGASEKTREKYLPTKEIHPGHERFAHAGLCDMAKECLMADGYSYDELRGLTREQIATAALGWPTKVGLRGDPGYHTIASFPNLTLDAANKSMRMGYTEEETTWQQVFRIGEDAQDFKNINRVALGAVPNIPQWIDSTDPRQLAINDEKLAYAVECYSAELSFGYKLLVNDDMSALARVPAKMGASMNRTINVVAWAEVTQASGVGPTMADGQALFSTVTGNRFRANYTTGAGTPTVANVGTLRNQLRQMRGINVAGPGDTVAESDDILRIRPQFIVGPTALETTILQLVNSIADPAASGNAGIFNPARALTPVIEPLLDAATNGTTAWYLMANPNQVDTVEVTFLAGQRTPVTRNWTDEKTLSLHWAILQSFAAKVLDYRGMARHRGA